MRSLFGERARRGWRALALGLAAAAAALLIAPSASAEDGPIVVHSTAITSQFPEGIFFQLNVESESEIESVSVKFKAALPRAAEVKDYLEFEAATVVDGELFWRTNTSARYIPPGSLLHVRFEIEDADGNVLVTEPEDFVYQDPRFTWEEISEGPVTVAYHGPVKRRAENVLDAVIKTIDLMGPLLGADISVPMRVTIYNNNREMLSSMPPRSATTGRELITEGRAFGDYNVVLVLGSGRLALGTAGHEVIHILVDRAGAGRVGFVPSWLNEGLAEFGNPEPSFSYDVALEFAIETNQLLPVIHMQAMPGDPEKAIIFYGQSRSIVSYMVYVYGPDRMRQLMATLKGGKRIDTAVEEVYGLTLEELDTLWREAVGAPDYVASEIVARPTAEAQPTIELYTIGSQAVLSGDDEEAETTASSESVEEPDAADSAEPAPDDDAGTDEAAEQSGGGCTGTGGANGMMDFSAALLIAGVGALAVRKRFGRR